MKAHRLRLQSALLPDGWADDVVLTIDAHGTIAEIARLPGGDATHPTDPTGPTDPVLPADPTGPTDPVVVQGAAIPGMPNLHSHAFQRAMAGLAERGGGSADDFWSWRSAMYRIASRLDPAAVSAIAAQLYVEMLEAGYTAVGEFHYLHHDRDGAAYADPLEMSSAVVDAARRTGIGLTLLPALYMRGGFDASDVEPEQRRFRHDPGSWLDLVRALVEAYGSDPRTRVGAAFHSLRAVPPEAIAPALDALATLDATQPVHVHVAEQRREVEQCVASTNARPIEWLLGNLPLDRRWCLVHATHATDDELRGVAGAGAVVGLCPSTEANLGDGSFRLAAFREAGGVFGIGSDSHVTVDPCEELRWLDYQQRLAFERRMPAGTPGACGHAGTRLWRSACAGGARALGRPVGALSPGCRADLVVLDTDHPALAGRDDDARLDTLVFATSSSPIRHVMVGGRWVVRDGRHVDRDETADAYRHAVQSLGAG